MGNYTDYLAPIAAEDARFLVERDRSYGSSWKRRGGVGAFMMLARKWDRLEQIISKLGRFGGDEKDAPPYDVFKWIERECSSEKEYIPLLGQGQDGSVLAEVRDLRRYLLLVEAEMVGQGVVAAPVPVMVHSGIQDGAYKPASLQEIMARPGVEQDGGKPAIAVPAEDSNRHAPRLRRQANHSELMDLPQEDQLRYRWVEAEQSYVRQSGRVVGGYFLPERVSKEEYNSMMYVMRDVNLLSHYVFDHSNQTWLLLEADRD